MMTMKQHFKRIEYYNDIRKSISQSFFTLSSSSTTTTTKDKNGNLEKMNTSEFNATQGSFYFYFLGGHWDLGNCPRNLGGPFPCFGGERETQREREREGGEANVGLFV